MVSKKWLAILAVVLVAGLAFGTVSTASAATASDNPVVAGVCGLGLKIGATVRDAGGRLADVLASLTGKSVEDIQAERQAGTSFAEIAEESGVAPEDVVDEALAVRAEALAAAVAAGTITQEQADAALAQMETRLTERVASTTAGCNGAGAGQGMGQGMGQGRGMGRNGSGTGVCQAPVTQ